jgi:hypothetical protein
MKDSNAVVHSTLLPQNGDFDMESKGANYLYLQAHGQISTCTINLLLGGQTVPCTFTAVISLAYVGGDLRHR